MATGTKDERHGQIFFELDKIKGEITLTHEQGEKFIDLVVSSAVFSDAPIKKILGLGEKVKLTVAGWTFKAKE